jgi:tetratricopeptide (TPR) repeat protein
LAAALWRFWQQRGYLNEARARFEQLAAQGWALEPIDQARFDEAYGGIAYWQSDQSTAVRLYDDALRIWREVGDRREIANALYNRAYADMIEIMEGRATAPHQSSGRAKLDEALAIYRELGDTGGEGNILWGLGSLAYFSSDAETAESWYRESLELHREPNEGGLVAAHARAVAGRQARLQRRDRDRPTRPPSFLRVGRRGRRDTLAR